MLKEYRHNNIKTFEIDAKSILFDNSQIDIQKFFKGYLFYLENIQKINNKDMSIYSNELFIDNSTYFKQKNIYQDFEYEKKHYRLLNKRMNDVFKAKQNLLNKNIEIDEYIKLYLKSILKFYEYLIKFDIIDYSFSVSLLDLKNEIFHLNEIDNINFKKYIETNFYNLIFTDFKNYQDIYSLKYKEKISIYFF